MICSLLLTYICYSTAPIQCYVKGWLLWDETPHIPQESRFIGQVLSPPLRMGLYGGTVDMRRSSALETYRSSELSWSHLSQQTRSFLLCPLFCLVFVLFSILLSYSTSGLQPLLPPLLLVCPPPPLQDPLLLPFS